MGKVSDWKKASHIGPGGMRCMCCGPAPGRDRVKTKRLWKHREKQMLKHEIKEELKEIL
jgi:hypothetical protein